MLEEISDNFVNWSHKFLIPFIWLFSISAASFFLFGELQHILDLNLFRIPEPLPFWLAVIGGLLSIPIFFSLINSVLYGKINPYDVNVRFNQTLKEFVVHQVLGSLAIFIISILIPFLFFSWSWFFQICFALEIASIFYMFMDSAVIELLKTNSWFEGVSSVPSVREIAKRGAVGEIKVRNWSEQEKLFGRPKPEVTDVEKSEINFSDISNSILQKLTQIFNKLKDARRDKILEAKKDDSIPNYESEKWMKKEPILQNIEQVSSKQVRQKEDKMIAPSDLDLDDDNFR